MLSLNFRKDVWISPFLQNSIPLRWQQTSKSWLPPKSTIRLFNQILYTVDDVLFTTDPLTRHNSFFGNYILLSDFSRWGDCLVMVASQELREKALLGVHCDPNVAIIDIQYCLLEHIGQARYNGRMQRAMGSSFLKMEPKSLFHYLKGLRMLGLITLQASWYCYE